MITRRTMTSTRVPEAKGVVEVDDCSASTISTTSTTSHGDSVNPRDEAESVVGIVSCLKNFRLEPMIFVFVLGMTLIFATSQNLYLDRVCSVNLELNSSICDNITEHSDEENRVQTLANTYLLYQNVLQGAPGIFLSLIMGPISDWYGRRSLLLFCMTCSLTSIVIYIVLLLCNWLPAQYFLLASIPVAVSGGSACFMMLTFSYIGDISSLRQRTFRISLVDMCFFAPLAIGFVASGYALPRFGYVKLYTGSLVLVGMALMYGAIFLSESVPNVHSGHRQVSPSSVCAKANPVHLWSTMTRSRPGYNRSILLVACMAFVIQQMSFSGEAVVTLQFVKKEFDWSFTQYTNYSCFVLAICIIFNVAIVPLLSNWLRLGDALIGLIAAVCRLISLLARSAVGSNSLLFYTASLIGLPGVMIVTTLRSIVSKAVSPYEIGTVYACLSAVEAVCSMSTASLFLLLYNSLLVYGSPALVYLAAAILFLPLLLIYILLLWRERCGHLVLHGVRL